MHSSPHPLTGRLLLLALTALGASGARAQSPIKARWSFGGWNYSEQAATYSRQGDKVLVWDAKFQGLRVYQSSDGKILSQINLSKAIPPSGACFSADGGSVFFGTANGRLFAYNVASRSSTLILEDGAGAPVTNLALSKAGDRIAYLSGGKLNVVNPATKTRVASFAGPSSTAGLAFAANDTRLVTSGPTIYSLVSGVGAPLPFPYSVGTVLKRGNYASGPIFVSPDGTKIVTADRARGASLISGYDATVNYTLTTDYPSAWMRTPLTDATPQAADKTIMLGGFSSDGTRALYSSNKVSANAWDWSVKALSASDGAPIGGRAGWWGSTAAPLVAISPAASQLFILAGSLVHNYAFGVTPVGTLLSDTVVLTPNSPTPRPVSTDTVVGGAPVFVTDEYYVQQGSTATFTTERLIRDAKTGAVSPFRFPGTSVNGRVPANCFMSPDGAYFAELATTLKAVNVYRLPANGGFQLVASLPLAESFSRVVWGGTGRLFLIGSGNPRIVNFAGGQLASPFVANAKPDGFVASPDGAWYAQRDGTSAVQVYSASDNKRIATVSPLGLSNGIGSVSFGGGLLAVQENYQVSGTYRNAIRTFELPATSPTSPVVLPERRRVEYAIPATLNGKAALTAGALSPDGEMVVLSHSAEATNPQTDPMLHSSVRMFLEKTGEPILPSQMDEQFVPNMDVDRTLNAPVFAFAQGNRTVRWLSGGALVAASTGLRIGSLTLTPGSLAPNATADGKITLEEPFDEPVTVQLSSDSTDVTLSAGSVQIPAGATVATFRVTAKAISATTVARVTAKVGGRSATADVRVVVAALDALALSPSTVRPGDASVGTVTLTDPAPTGGAKVTLTSNSAAAILANASVTIPAGSRTGTFPVQAQPGLANLTVATITASYNNVSRTASLTVNPLPVTLESVTITNQSPLIGGYAGYNKAQGKVTLSSPAPNGGVRILLTTEPSSPLTVPAELTVPAQATEATFEVAASGVSAAKAWKVTAWYDGAGKDASVQVAPFALKPALAITGANPVLGGTALTVTATLEAPLPIPTTVAFGSDKAGAANFVGAAASVTIPAGSTAATTTVTTFAVVSETAATLTAKLDGGNSVTGVLRVVPLGLSRIVVDSASAMGGSAGIKGRVFLNGPVPLKEITITLSADDKTAVTFKPTSVKAKLGALVSPDFVLTPKVLAATKTVRILATWAGHNSVETTLEVRAAKLTDLTIPATLTGGAKGATGSVTLDEAPAADLTITLVSSNTRVLKLTSVTVKKGTKTATFALSPTKVTAATPITVTARLGTVSIAKPTTVNP